MSLFENLPSPSAILLFASSDFDTSIVTLVTTGIVAVSPLAGMKQSIPEIKQEYVPYESKQITPLVAYEIKRNKKVRPIFKLKS